MRKYALPLNVLAATLVIVLQASPAQAQATRTWVSGVGDDANPCSRTAPCKTFAGAISKTAASGIINCLDPAGFGTLTITKSITLDCTGVMAGMLAAATNGININAAASDIVTLRGLNIEGVGSGLIGINVISGTTVHVERCNIFGFRSGSAIGIKFAPPAGTIGDLFVSDTVISDNGSSSTNGGIVIQPTSSGGAKVVLNRVQIKNNSSGLIGNGIGSTGGIRISMLDSTVAGHLNAGVAALMTAGGSNVSVLVDRVTLVNNGVGIQTQGPSTLALLRRSIIFANQIGILPNDSFVFSYRDNSIDGNLSIDGAPTGSVLLR